MVKEVKATVLREDVNFEIKTRRAKSGNMVLETADKVHADKLASILARKYGDTKRVRRPCPTVALLLIGIELKNLT